MDSIMVALFVLAGIIAAGGFVRVLLRAERVGTLDCPCRVDRDMLSTRLTIARESAGARPPTVQVRVHVPAHFVAHRITAAQASELAALLESASAQLRQP